MPREKNIIAWEEEFLAPYAARPSSSRGRIYKEKKHPYRSDYQRDRDRIIHSAAFRRLEYKTQVFIYHEGDYYRTRLTHTLEVAQIARTISKALRLSEDLTEAIALAHDLGHTPFGHAGEDILNNLMEGHEGFDHNIQGLRVVDILEKRYPEFSGLNLSWETREGIIKHTTKYDNVGAFLEKFSDLCPEEQPTLEAQVVDKADEIAYDNHDLDDGIKSGMLEVEELEKIALWKKVEAQVKKDYTNLKKNIFIYQMIRRLINLEVGDLIAETSRRIKKAGIGSLADAKHHQRRLVGFGKETQELRDELRAFLYDNLYCNWRVTKMSHRAQLCISKLFQVYCSHPHMMPPKFEKNIGRWGLERVVSDYIAGMTDRYAMEEHNRLFETHEKF